MFGPWFDESLMFFCYAMRRRLRESERLWLCLDGGCGMGANDTTCLLGRLVYCYQDSNSNTLDLLPYVTYLSTWHPARELVSEVCTHCLLCVRQRQRYIVEYVVALASLSCPILFQCSRSLLVALRSDRCLLSHFVSRSWTSDVLY